MDQHAVLAPQRRARLDPRPEEGNGKAAFLTLVRLIIFFKKKPSRVALCSCVGVYR